MRLSSIEAVEVNDEFISTAANCEHLCPQFHPALQSGSETVLRRMRRRYSISRFQEKLQQMREQLDRPAFTTDVIVGFPGETEQEFEETLESDRILGTLFDEILYADDTLIYSRNEATLEKLLHKIEKEGNKYGLKLNMKKCEALSIREHGNIRFSTGEKVEK